MILIDTHVVAWLAFERKKISNNAAIAISEARTSGQPLAISDVSLWELAVALHRKRIPTDLTVEAVLDEVEARFQILPITSRVAAGTSRLPPGFPKDPGDRIITCTALIGGMALVTADAAIRRSGVVQTIW